MSATLWVDEANDEAIDLGETFGAYKAFAEMAKLAGDKWESHYGDLGGVLSQCEIQEDSDPSWLTDARRQAAEFRSEFGDTISDLVRDVLDRLIDPPVAANAADSAADEDEVAPGS